MSVSKQPPAATIPSEGNGWLRSVLKATKEALQISIPVLVMLGGYIIHTERFHERVQLFMDQGDRFTLETYLTLEAEHDARTRAEYLNREVLEVEFRTIRATLVEMNQKLSRLENRLDKTTDD